MDNISQETKTAIEVVLQVGKNLKPHFGKTVVQSWKSQHAGDAVTKLDIETEKFIFENLKQKFPSIGFKGEELGSVDISSGKFWLVDPIDGTAYFSRGIKGCSTMLALIDDGQVKIGIIYDFIDENLYFAEKGKGAYHNYKQMYVSKRDIKDSLVFIECKVTDEVSGAFLELQKRYDVASAGYPAGTEFAMVARGQVEGRICLNAFGGEHDFAPGSLIVQEAGGVVANLGKTTYDYTNRNFIAANKILFEDLTSGENSLFPIRD
jgi:myo-inositol-1(or 4)-monophosphatase